MEAKENDRFRLWFASTPTVLDPLTDKPAAYAVLEVQVTKRVVIPTTDMERVQGAAAILGIPEVASVIDAVRKTPLELRPHIRVDWTDAPAGVFSAEQLSAVVSMNENIISWRIEGDLFKGQPLSLAINAAGMEWRIPTQKDSLKPLFLRLKQRYIEAQAVSADNTATDAAKQAAEAIRKTVECILGGIEAIETESWGAAGKALLECYDAKEQWDAAQDAAQKALEAQKANGIDKAGSSRGDKGDGDVMIKVGPGLWQT